jgi:hypothetical protein
MRKAQAVMGTIDEVVIIAVNSANFRNRYKLQKPYLEMS